MKGSRRNVVLEVETSLAPGRDMVRGIAKFVGELNHWDVHHDAGLWFVHGSAGPSRIEPLTTKVAPDGIITRIYDEESSVRAVEAAEKGIPVVDILGDFPASSAPLVHTDDEAIAQLVFAHLSGLGFQHFGFCGIENTPWSVRRGDGFRAEVEKGGRDFSLLELSGSGLVESPRDGEKVREWLEALPKPAGIFVSCDHYASWVLQACSDLGVTVPENVAVVGVNNDTVVCSLCNPTLSSVDASHLEIGYQAARLLDKMMRGEAPPEEPVYIAPSELIVRGSSSETAIGDSLIAKVARYISRNAGNAITVDDVADVVPISLRSLQRRFRSHTGKTIHEAIVAARVKIARGLLTKTDYKIDVVAEMAGFRTRQHFARIFKEHTGTAPIECRREFRRES